MPSSDAGSSGSGLARSATRNRPRPPQHALSFLDHPGAHVDADDLGAAIEQPLGLRPRTASGVQHHGTCQAAGNQRPEGRPLQEPVERPLVGGRRPHRRQLVVGLTGSLGVLSLISWVVKRHAQILGACLAAWPVPPGSPYCWRYARAWAGTSAASKPRGLVVQLGHLRCLVRSQAADGSVQHLDQATQPSGLLRQPRPARLLNAGRSAP